jgi:two-component system chemotaxis response regulator CheY
VSETGRQARILIVEDSPAMRHLLTIAVKRRGAQVTEAPDGLAALQCLKTDRYDLVLVDLNMPILDGMKLIQRIRSDRSLDATRICVVTTESSEEAERDARALGADFYLKKPIGRREVERVLEEAFPAG